MRPQRVLQVENYGVDKATAKINSYLETHPRARIVSITPTRIDFAGGEQGNGLIVILEADDAASLV